MTNDGGWSRESCIAALERAVEELGPDFTQTEYELLSGVPSRDVIREEFGGIHRAKREIGLNSSPLKYSDRDCLEAIRLVSREVGHPASAGEYIEAVAGRDLPSRTTIFERFGSYPAARQLAIEGAASEFKTWAYSSLLERARDRASGRLTRDKFEALTNSDGDAVAEWLGGGDWSDALSVADVEHVVREDSSRGGSGGGGGRPEKYSNEDILGAVREASSEVVGALYVSSYEEYRETSDHELPGSYAIIDRFGSWNEAKQEAGLGPTRGYGHAEWTATECAEAIVEASGGDPSGFAVDDYVAYRRGSDEPMPSKDAIAYNDESPYNSWPEAREAAGDLVDES